MDQLTPRTEPDHPDLYDTVAELRSLVEHSYDHALGGSRGPLANRLDDPASQWVALAVIAGRSLPINPATVTALRRTVEALRGIDRPRAAPGA